MRRISSPGSIHKGKMLSAVFYILALILLVTAVTALAACHKNISLQLEQGVPVAGNELAIVNLYLSSCVQYFALSAILIFCGYVLPRVAAQKLDLQPEASSPLLNGPIEAVSEEVDGSRQETADTVFEEWGFKERGPE